MFKYIYILFILTLSTSAWAQPANDNCGGAIVIPQNGSCVAATTAAATDGWVGSVGCASNNVNEVWFEFTATGTQADITINQGTMTGNIEVIVVGSTGPCAGLGLMGSNCGPGPSTVTTLTNLVVGETYYVTVNPTGADGTFTICNLVSTPPPTPGQDCAGASVLCNENGFSVGTVASGAGSVSGNGSNEDVSVNSCFGGDERQSQWYTFCVDESGDVEFQIAPNTFSNDYDWALYDITTSGCALASQTPIACNWSFCSGMTGMTSSIGTYTGGTASTSDYLFGNPAGPGSCDGAVGGPDNGNGSSQWENPVNLVAGNTYAILIDNFSSSNDGFDFTWTGTDAQIGPDAEFAASLDASCLTATVDRLTNYTGPNMTYLWNFGDGTTSTDAVPPPHLYASSGLFTISCEVTDAVGCVTSFSRVVDVGCLLLSSKLLSFEGIHAQNHNLLSWTMESNLEVDYFTIQRSIDGINWTDIHRTDAYDNNNNTFYNYEDESYVFDNNNYYRLKLHSQAGTETLSDVIVLENEAFSSLGGLYIHGLYPSPVEGELTIELESNIDQDIKISLFDMLGHLVYQKEIQIQSNLNKLALDLSNLDSGVYMLQLEDPINKVTQLKKVVKR